MFRMSYLKLALLILALASVAMVLGNEPWGPI